MVWQLVAPRGWAVPDKAEVCAESALRDRRRIDVAIRCDDPQRRIVGIEVKMTDSSATSGQLQQYYEDLKSSEGYEVAWPT